MKIKKLFSASLIILFLFSQVAFSTHQLSHFEETNHHEDCFVCGLDSSVSWNLSKKTVVQAVFKKLSLCKRTSLVFVNKDFYRQFLPRSPPLS